MTATLPRVSVGSLAFDPLSEQDVVRCVFDALDEGRGGRISTPNVDILRRSARDLGVRTLLGSADLVVADGAPVIWASWLAGQALPERVAGSSLLFSLSAAAAVTGRGVYLLGAEPGVAARAGQVLAEGAPGLRMAGVFSPPAGFESRAEDVAEIRARLIAADPSIVFVALGCPKQERLIAELRSALPHAWWIGCGAALDFAAGTLRRAPRWMQATGLEWLHRLAAEPRRLARRYLIDDAPYAVALLADAVRIRRRTASRVRTARALG